MYLFKCDKCGKQSEPQKQNSLISYFPIPDQWREISFNVVGRGYVRYHLCPECCKKILPPPNDEKETTIGDKLIDIISEIVRDNLPNG